MFRLKAGNSQGGEMYDIRPNQEFVAPQPMNEPAPPVAPDPGQDAPTDTPTPSSSPPPAIPRGNLIGNISGLIIILTIVLVGGLFGYNYLKKSKISSTTSNLNQVNADLETLKETDQKVTALQSQIDNMNQALSQRNYYSLFFAKLTPLLPKDTVLNTLSFSENEIQASGLAASFDSVARLLASVRKSDQVEDVSLASATAGDTSVSGLTVSFSLSIKVKPSATSKEKSKTINTSETQSNQNEGQSSEENLLNEGR